MVIIRRQPSKLIRFGGRSLLRRCVVVGRGLLGRATRRLFQQRINRVPPVALLVLIVVLAYRTGLGADVEFAVDPNYLGHNITLNDGVLQIVQRFVVARKRDRIPNAKASGLEVRTALVDSQGVPDGVYECS